MRCQEVRSWTFKALLAAFLDLSVAFLLLCASSLVYLSSKFLNLFGLNLPCPCDGIFSDPNKNKCFQETLGHFPVKKIFAVQRSVKNRTPFDSNGDCFRKKRKGERRGVEIEGEASSTPSSEVVENASGLDLLASQSFKKGSIKVKSKRLSFHRSPYGLTNHCQEGEKTLEDMSLRKSVSLSSVKCEAGVQTKKPERTLSLSGKGTCSSPMDILEKLLAEERAVRATLALELEKERNAAATAADEALSMILRLQEEKASIEMEARQYQRMIEEKSAFDAEEMSILKEILIRREREKHFLEKEVESYKQMVLETERSVTPQQMTDPLDYMETADSDLLALGNISVLLGDYDIDDSPKPKEVEYGVDQTRSEGLDVNDEIIKLVVESKEGDESGLFPDSKKLSEESLSIDCYVGEDIKVEVNGPSDYVTQDLKLDRTQSVSDTSYGLRLIYPPRKGNMFSNMRRNSMSAVDCERMKIESEVGMLRGRLRAVQKGREKISFSSNEHSKSQDRLGDKTSRFCMARRSGVFDSSSPSSTLVKAMSMTLDLDSP